MQPCRPAAGEDVGLKADADVLSCGLSGSGAHADRLHRETLLVKFTQIILQQPKISDVRHYRTAGFLAGFPLER